jgi:hypothetical protein
MVMRVIVSVIVIVIVIVGCRYGAHTLLQFIIDVLD